MQSRSSNSSRVAYRWGSMGFIDFFPDAKHLSAVNKSAFADILGEPACMVTYITAQYRHIVVCSGLLTCSLYMEDILFRIH